MKGVVSSIALSLQQQLVEEEDLAKKQSDTLRVNHKKLELIEGIEGSLKRLAYHYGGGDKEWPEGAPAPPTRNF